MVQPLRNPTAEVLLGQMGLSISRWHKAEAARLLAKHKLNKPETFYWRGRRGTPRKAGSIDSIPDRPLSIPPATIAFISAEKGTIIAEVAVAAASQFRRIAPVLTGLYAGSLLFELNGKRKSLVSIVRFATTNPYGPRETVTMFPATVYASKLEADLYLRRDGGILFRIASDLIAQFGSKASIKFAYASGVDLGLPYPYAVPLIVIGGPGQFPSTLRKPGSKRRRLARKAKRKAQ